jgi:hypothetical protein
MDGPSSPRRVWAQTPWLGLPQSCPVKRGNIDCHTAQHINLSRARATVKDLKEQPREHSMNWEETYPLRNRKIFRLYMYIHIYIYAYMYFNFFLFKIFSSSFFFFFFFSCYESENGSNIVYVYVFRWKNETFWYYSKNCRRGHK